MEHRIDTTIKRSSRLVLSGLDSLYVSYFLNVQDGRRDFDELSYLKERLRGSRTDKISDIELGDMQFVLKPYGKFPYSYVLSNELFDIRLSERLKPACHVQFHSEGLWMLGLDNLLGKLTDWFSVLNLASDKPEVVSLGLRLPITRL